MAGRERQRGALRVNYESLRERLWQSGLPWDDEAERNAIGAVLLAPKEHARKFVRRAYRGHFYDKGHGWLWEEIGLAIGKQKLDFDTDFMKWMEAAQVLKRFKAEHWGSARKEIMACIEEAYWWHGNYYIDRVIAAAKVRAKIVTSAELLSAALTAAEQWRRAP